MSWTDRDYNQSKFSGRGGQLLAMLNGSVSLGTWFGVRVRVHATLIIFIALTILFGGAAAPDVGFAMKSAATGMAVLFGIVLLHEFGHCAACRMVGGQADQILLWPLGGLAFTGAPHRPWAQFWTSVGGPLVNVAICLVTCAGIWILRRSFPHLLLDPFHPAPLRWHVAGSPASSLEFYFGWIFYISYVLLLFNLWPIFPLDGGQILQSLLWVKVGYFKSMNFACVTGLVGAGAMAIVGLASGQWLLVFIAISGYLTCLQMRAQLKAIGPDGFEGEYDSIDYSASLRPESPRRRKLNKRVLRRAQRREAEERDEQVQIDQILAKVSAQGMNSLTWLERRALKKATERQRKRDVESPRHRH